MKFSTNSNNKFVISRITEVMPRVWKDNVLDNIIPWRFKNNPYVFLHMYGRETDREALKGVNLWVELQHATLIDSISWEQMGTNLVKRRALQCKRSRGQISMTAISIQGEYALVNAELLPQSKFDSTPTVAITIEYGVSKEEVDNFCSWIETQ